MKYLKYILLLIVLSAGLAKAQSQSLLRVTYMRFGSPKIIDVLNTEMLEFKLKGEHHFNKDKIIKLQDSTILFENYTEVKLDQIKALRLRKHNPLITTFQTIFFMVGVGFVTLNTVNNVITDTSPVFNEKAAYISAALLATGFLIREIGIVRVKMTKNKNIKIINIDFQHLNSDTTTTSSK
ncbi:hypothetical protein CNR22_21965 [Sphingobacteriaceae bacterium]|nr:hypothetical protein CNR22_21965 [Sphingobacteriaceae bacterium]